MQYALIYIEQLLLLLVLIISYRNFFSLKQKEKYIGALFLSASLFMLFFRLMLPYFLAVLCCLSTGLAMMQYLFLGSWKKKAAFGAVFFLSYCLLFYASWSLLFANGILLKDTQMLNLFVCQLLCQLLYYVALFIISGLYHHRHYSLAYYFPLIPLAITIALICLWDSLVIKDVLQPYMPVFLLLLFIFDFGCLGMESWMIFSLHTRSQLRLEHVERQYLENKYESLAEQYEKSFSFLHHLLRNCADLTLSMEKGDKEAIEQSIQAIANEAFMQFNEVCINAPVLSRLLSQKAKWLDKNQIMVSTVIRNDHFGLLTFEEQNQLFSSLLEYTLAEVEASSAPVKMLAIKSTAISRDIMMVWIFSARKDEEHDPAFLKLQSFLSETFRAGVRMDYDALSQKAVMTIMLPMAHKELFQNTSDSLIQ